MDSRKDTLRIEEFQALETEYNRLVHHDPESSLSSAIADLLQELPTEVTTQETIKSVSKPVVFVCLLQLAGGDSQADTTSEDPGEE